MKIVATIILLSVILIMNVEATSLKNHVTEIDLLLKNGSKVEIILKKRQLDNSFPYESALMWGGDDGTLPKEILTMLTVKIAGRAVFIPLSAYGDLGAIKDASAIVRKNEFDVVILGGDASSSYRAVLQFKSGLLKRRQVVSQEFPDQVWQTTNYSFNTSER